MNRTYKQLIFPVLCLFAADSLLAVAAADSEAAVEGPSLASPATQQPVEVNGAGQPPAELPAAEDSGEESGPAAGQQAPVPATVSAANATLQEVLAAEPPGSPAIADAYEALALAEMKAGLYNAAEATLSNQIEALELQYGLYARQLSRPLELLGEVYFDSGRLDDAVDAYRRAQHLVHRADGVYTLAQLDHLEQISRVYIKKRKYAEADRHYRFGFFVSEQNFGEDSPELVPALMKLGRWYNRVGRVRDARRLFERATRIIEENLGPDDPQLIEPLLALGTTTRKKAQYRKQREQALNRMIEIVERDPTLDVSDRAASWARMGDFYIMVDDRNKAAEAYRKSWEALNAPEAVSVVNREALAEPEILHFQRRIYLMDKTPRSGFGGFDSSLEEFPTEMEFEVDIGPDGKAQKVKVLNLETTAATRRQIRRYLREARFRPRVIDGEVVTASGIRFKETVTIVRPEGS